MKKKSRKDVEVILMQRCKQYIRDQKSFAYKVRRKHRERVRYVADVFHGHSARRGRDETQNLYVPFIHAVSLEHGFATMQTKTFIRLSNHAGLEASELQHHSAVLLVYRLTQSLL